MDNTEAARTFAAWQKLFVPALLFCLIILVVLTSLASVLIVVVAILSLLYFADMIFNLSLVSSSLLKSSEFRIPKWALNKEREWPSYTIFCPLYKEAPVLEQFVEAIKKLDYPASKLRVLLLMEEDDDETIQLARRMELPEHFEVVIVPQSLPKTKPKACNYGLELTDSDYCVIYDAEDIPDKDQLKKAVLGFENAPADIACLQAKLNFYNTDQNIFTRLFTAEYSMWFNLTLVGLQNIRGPIPLGGTSNHFRTSLLKKLNGWDPYNVTEDCDLGIRLYRQGFRTAILDSTTYEEANSKFLNWLRQRSRWIKGYMQTFLVHTRKPNQIQKNKYDPHLFTFYIVIGGKVLSTLINPLMWVLTITYFILRPEVGKAIEKIYPAPVFYIAITTLIVGNILYLYYFMIGAAQRNQWRLIKYGVLVPFYWLMMSCAAVYALYQLIVKPHYWEKTVHGLHIKKPNADEVRI